LFPLSFGPLILFLKPMTAVAALGAAVTFAIQPSVPAGAKSSSAIFLDP
jgi:hypothetical protein